MDYLEEALDVLIKRKAIKSDKGLGLSGISKGGEISLAMMAYLPEDKIGAVAIMNSVMNLGVIPAVYKGKTVCEGR